MAEITGFDPAGWEKAIQNIQNYGTTARGDIETNFQSALDAIVASNQESTEIIRELEGGDSTNAARMVSLVRAPIDAAVSDAVRTMTDLRQRGGYSGSPRVRNLVESTVRSLVPLAGEKVSEALATKERLGLKRAGLAESLGTQKSGIFTEKGSRLADIGGNVSSQIASIEKAREQAKLDEARRLDDLKIGLLGAAKPDSVSQVYKSLGMEYNPNAGKTYDPSANAGAGGWAGGSASTTPASGGTDWGNTMKAYNQAQNLFTSYNDPWLKGGRNTAGMNFATNVMSQLNKLARV